MMPIRHALVTLVFLSRSVLGADAPAIEELPGPVVLAGKGDLAKDTTEAFFSLAGKDKAKIVVIARSAVKDEDALKPWKDLKPATITLLQVKDRKAADDPEFVKPITEAAGVWFPDGNADRETFRGTLIEAELKKLQARGGAVGASGAGAGLVASLGLFPGFLLNPKADSPLGAHVGLSLEEGSAVVIRGRTMQVIGERGITIRVGKGAGKPAAEQEAKAGSLFDLFQLRRAAANRAAKDAFPPARPKEPVVEKGALVIVGGGGTTPEIMNTFFARAGGKDRLIVVIPTTEADGPGDAAYLRKFGATNVKVLFTLDRKRADDPKFSDDLAKAGGVWFGGGRQWRFVDSFEGTLVEKRCRGVLARGGVIGGSSAGASIQSEYMPRGHPLGNTVMAAEGYERGFGFLPGCAVDQHFFARNRTADMTGLMKKYPQYLGIGIDEATAIVVTGSTAEVLGRSKVAFYDTNKKSTVGYDWDAGRNLVWFNQDYEEVRPGEKYDLKKREKISP
jgi:cyanophycinase